MPDVLPDEESVTCSVYVSVTAAVVDAQRFSVTLFVTAGPKIVVPFFLMVMDNGAVPPEALKVTLVHVPFSRVMSDDGEMAHNGIGLPVIVVELSQTQVVPEVLPVEESLTWPV